MHGSILLGSLIEQRVHGGVVNHHTDAKQTAIDAYVVLTATAKSPTAARTYRIT